MNVSAESYGHAVILNLKGDLTEDEISVVRHAVDHQLEDAQVIDLVLNLAEVPFIDSAALEYMLDLQDRLAERFGQVKLVHVEDNIQTILDVTRLWSSFEVFHDIPEAVKAIQP
jgi:anti-anti-sigma factor